MYHHTQSGSVTRIAAIAGVAVALFAISRVGAPPVLWIAIVAIGLAGLALGSMTTEVTQDRFIFWFGPGVIRRSFRLADLKSYTAVKNPWWYGWGIHLTPAGWLYNVGGWEAVQLELTDGRRLRVGTDEPERLCEAISAMKGTA